MKLVFIGLSITSSWGNGHATTYRSLIRELASRGHDVLFLERDVPWYRDNRDLPSPGYCRLGLYDSIAELKTRHGGEITGADAVIIGSYVPDGAEIASWVLSNATGIRAFYDIDTPVTLARLDRGECDYLRPDQIHRYDYYLSFTGGPALKILEERFGSPGAVPFYCSVDPDHYYPEPCETQWDLGYLGTYAEDRQPALQRLLMDPAARWSGGRFVVAGPLYPDELRWTNVERIDHLPPDRHRHFYNAQRYTLNITRGDMVQLGHSPSVRLFEAAACGVPIISDHWEGIERIFRPDEEILLADSPARVLGILQNLTEEGRRRIGEKARARVLAEHTAAHRALQLEQLLNPQCSDETQVHGT